MKEFDKAFIEELITTAQNKRLTGVKIKLNDSCIELELSAIKIPIEKKPNESAETVVTEHWVKSNLVGFFRMPKMPVMPGEEVNKETVIGVLEALGLPNDIIAGYDGVFDALVVSDGEPVEYGQKIARIKS